MLLLSTYFFFIDFSDYFTNKTIKFLLEDAIKSSNDQDQQSTNKIEDYSTYYPTQEQTSSSWGSEYLFGNNPLGTSGKYIYSDQYSMIIFNCFKNLLNTYRIKQLMINFKAFLKFDKIYTKMFYIKLIFLAALGSRV